MNATNILVYFTLIFKKVNENDQNNQETYKSVVEAGLSNYVNNPVNNQVVLKELRTHSQNINGCLKPYYEGEQCNLSSAGITKIDLYDAKIPEDGKLLGYYIPLSKILYQKILHLDITSFSRFDIKEIYEIITSEIYIIMDNSMLLINCILNVLNTAKEKRELLYEHHWQNIRNQLVTINGFEEIEMQLTRSGLLEDREKVMADIVNGLLALNNDPMVCHSIQNIYDRFNLWNNKFLKFLKEVKKKISFKISDKIHQYALIPSTTVDSETCIMPIFISEFNMYYVVHCLIMDYRFLEDNERLLVDKFNIDSTKWNFSLEIDFKFQIKEKNETAIDKINTLLNCSFVNCESINNIKICIYDTNMKLNTMNIPNKKSIICLSNCGPDSLSSLPKNFTELHMYHMKIVQSVILQKSINFVLCKNISMQDDVKISIPKKCANLTLTNVEGIIQCANLGIVKCLKGSWFDYSRDNDGYLGFSMTQVICQSDFEIHGNYMNLVLDNIIFDSQYIMKFTGILLDASISNCAGTINFQETEYSDTFTLVKSSLSNCKVILPKAIRILTFYDVHISHKLMINSHIGFLCIKHVKIETGQALTVQFRCIRVDIFYSSGMFKLFDETIQESQNDSSKQNSIYKQRGNDLFVIKEKSLRLEMNSKVVKSSTTVYMEDVIFEGPIFWVINNHIESFVLYNVKGTISLTGIITGEFFGNYLGLLSIVRVKHEMPPTITITGLIVSKPVDINCILDSLTLENIKYDISEPIFKVYYRCSNINVCMYTGLLTISSLSLVDVHLTKAILIYNEVENSLTINGETKLGRYSLPSHIRHLFLNMVVMTASNVFYLHETLTTIEISNCKGLFVFKGLFDILKLELKERSVIKFHVVAENLVTLELCNLTIENSIFAEDCIRELILKKIHSRNYSIFKIGSTCLSISVINSSCEIHLKNKDKTVEIVCRKGEQYVFWRDDLSELFHLELIKSFLSRKIALPDNVQHASFKEVHGTIKYPIIINDACTKIEITKCSGVIKCPNVKNLDSISVNEFSDHNLEIHLGISRSLVIRIVYEFTDTDAICIYIHLKISCHLLFSQHSLEDTLTKPLRIILQPKPHLNVNTVDNVMYDDQNQYVFVHDSSLDTTEVLKRHLNSNEGKKRIPASD